jgi:hypothetical protein
MLVEINGMAFQFPDFKKHFWPSAPPTHTAQAAEAHTDA